MSPDAERKVSLEELHRHFLVTHLKGNAARVLDQLEKRWVRPGEPFANLLAELVEAYDSTLALRDDNWYDREIQLDRCYCPHPDFRRCWVPKGQRYVDFLGDRLKEIEQGSFPCSYEIRLPWSTSKPMPRPLAQERKDEPGNYYIADGQLRVIRHWYHQKQVVSVYLYRGEHGL